MKDPGTQTDWGRQTGRLLYDVSQGGRVLWFLAHYYAAARLAPPVKGPPPSVPLPAWGDVLKDLRALMERDRTNIEAGLYPPPADMVPAPGRLLRRSLEFFRDLPEVNRRRTGATTQEVTASGHERLPRYYRQNFHFQSGGYLSEDSARLYDYQVEVLFTGGADAMRRQALVPMGEHLRRVGQREARLLDVACGTGRFLFAVKDAFPRLAVTGLDLSVPYLAAARRRLGRWSRTSLIQAKGEAIPLAANSLDLVTCVYLFHELPRAVRSAVAREVARVLKPGGRLVFVDSIQRGDHPPYDGLLERFPLGFHEPYFADYARTDLEGLFAEAGLTTLATERAFFSRMMTLEKRGEKRG